MSGEINTQVSDAKAVVAKIKSTFAQRAIDEDELDGLTISLDSGWFNVRSSNTEPLLRLNVEATEPDVMAAIRDEVLGIMNGSL